jgi:hypothetical protein
MKVYQKIFNDNLGTINEIKRLRQRRNELVNEINSSDDSKFSARRYQYNHEAQKEFGENLLDEQILLDLLIRDIDEACYQQPFEHIREQGKEAFWELVNGELEVYGISICCL